jgi:enoyl-CoA hydratase
MMAAGSLVLKERVEDQVVVLRLNRPDRLNAVSLPLYQDLLAALEECDHDPAVRAVVITGQGRAFCVGADLKAHGTGDLTLEERNKYVSAGQRMYQHLQSLTKPTVAAVNGHAIGAGIELALSCDFVVVAEDAKLRLPELGLGTFVGGGTVYTLAHRVGVAKAKELIMLGEFFSGRDAVEMGLANTAVPVNEVWDESLTLARKLAGQAPIPMRLAKELIHRAQRLSYEEALDEEAKALLRCMETRDWKEGIAAFQEKRAPHFTGE